MAERSFPFTTTGAGNATAYTEANTVEWLTTLFHPGQNWGVLRGYLNEIAPSVSSGNIAIATGAAVIQGYWYRNDASKTVTVGTPAVGTTGYRVVLRITFASDTITAVLLSSSDGVSALPSLTQNGTTWEESICSFTKTTGGTVTMTDTRVFAQHGTNHVKRDGDTVTGALAVTGALTHNGSTVWDAGNLLLSRLGGSATVWSTTGTNSYTPTNARIQVGSTNVTAGGQTITFPVAFSNIPIVTVTSAGSGAGASVGTAYNITATTFQVWVGTTGPLYWIAIGPP